MSMPKHRPRAIVRRRRISVVFLLLLTLATVAAIGIQFFTHRTVTTSTSTSSTTTSTLPPTPLAVGVVTLNVTEPTPAGQPVRTLLTTVRYPAIGTASASDVAGALPRPTGGPYPLVVFSQGFGIAPESYALLLHAWAAAGYVVADPAYPFTSLTSPGGLVRADVVHHPADLSYVITSLLNATTQSSGPLSGLIDTTEIAVIGHSDGGDVSLAAVANSCCRDVRIKAAVILSGAELSWFKGAYFATPTVPLLVVQGTSDNNLNAVFCSQEIYNEDRQTKYYLSLIGATHVSAYIPPGPSQRVLTDVTIDFLNSYLRHATPSVAQMIRAGTVAGIAAMTSQATLTPTSGFCADSPVG